jgi:hypothetical protein
MSVVGNDFEELKKFNLAEIYQPTPKPISTTTATPQMIGDAPPSDMTRLQEPLMK